jgi:hypothetical protein
MIANKILLLKREATLPNGITLPTATEFHIVMDVVYMKGFPVPAGLQSTFYNWIKENPTLFREIFR